MKNYKKINLSEFQNYFLKLFTSTIIAQIIGIAASPILTRLYTPEQYGIYGVYLSLITILVVLATFRYEFSIGIVETEELGSVYNVIKILSIIISLITFVVLSILNLQQFDIIIITMLSTSIFVLAENQYFQYLHNRFKNFNILSRNRILQILITSLCAIILGLFIPEYGLIISNIIGLLMVSIFLKKNVGFKTESFNINDVKHIVRKYKDFAIFNTPSALLDVIALQSPILFISLFFGHVSSGVYSLTMRTVMLPLNLISVSLSQVFLSKISENYRKNIDFHRITKKLMILLFFVGLIPTFLLMIYSKLLFVMVFGENWEKSGEIAAILAIPLLFRFVASPLSNIFFIVNKLKILFYLQLFRGFSTMIVLTLSSLTRDFDIFIINYAIHETVYYIFYIILIYYVSSKGVIRYGNS